MLITMPRAKLEAYFSTLEILRYSLESGRRWRTWIENRLKYKLRSCSANLVDTFSVTACSETELESSLSEKSPQAQGKSNTLIKDSRLSRQSLGKA